jgi:hypothetical protein
LETSKELTVKSISLSIPIETLLFAKTVIYKYRVKSNRLTFYNRKIFFKVFTIKNLKKYICLCYHMRDLKRTVFSQIPYF